MEYADLNSATLAYRVSNASAADAGDATPDGMSAFHIFSRYRILSSTGAILEQLDSANLADTVICQYTKSAEEQHALSGMANGLTELTYGNSRRVQCPMNVSGWFRNSTSKALPPCSWVLELTIAPTAECWVSDGAATLTYDDFHLCIPCVSVPHEFTANLEAMARAGAGAIQFTAATMRSYFGTLQGAGAGHVVAINDRSISLRSLLACIRNPAQTSVVTNYGLSRRSIGHISEYVWEAAGELWPPSSVTVGLANDTADAYASVLRVWGSTTDATSYVTHTEYSGGLDISAVDSRGILGQSFEAFEDNGLVSGLNSALYGGNVSLRVTTTAATALQVIVYAISDVVFSIDPDTREIIATI